MATHPGRARRRRVLLVILLALLVAASGCTAIKRWAYASGDRDSWQQAERVVEQLGLSAGQHVADLGAGGGYFTFRLADAVGKTGLVYAVDVDEAMNEALAKDAREKGYANVKTVLAGFEDPHLAPASVDLVFSSNTYHHIQDRVRYFANAAKVLRPGGRLAIVEFKPEGWFQKRHATGKDVVRSELEAAGYRLLADHDYLERQHFLVFAPPAAPDLAGSAP